MIFDLDWISLHFDAIWCTAFSFCNWISEKLVEWSYYLLWLIIKKTTTQNVCVSSSFVFIFFSLTLFRSKIQRWPFYVYQHHLLIISSLIWLPLIHHANATSDVRLCEREKQQQKVIVYENVLTLISRKLTKKMKHLFISQMKWVVIYLFFCFS